MKPSAGYIPLTPQGTTDGEKLLTLISSDADSSMFSTTCLTKYIRNLDLSTTEIEIGLRHAAFLAEGVV